MPYQTSEIPRILTICRHCSQRYPTLLFAEIPNASNNRVKNNDILNALLKQTAGKVTLIDLFHLLPSGERRSVTHPLPSRGKSKCHGPPRTSPPPWEETIVTIN